MTTMSLQVEGMSCGHCVNAVTAAIRGKDPQATVQVDLRTGMVHADTALPRATVVTALEAEGYPVKA